MPFRKVNDKVEWVPPTEKDLAGFAGSLVSESGSVPLTHELKTRVEEALKSVSPKGNVAAFTENNASTYSLIKHLIKTPPGLVDVILPVFNSFHLVKKCIDLVLKRTHWPFHLYIVDDCSDNYTENKLKEIQQKHSNKITLIRHKKNKGFATSVNTGIKQGNGKYVCLLNSDVFVTDLWLTKMVMTLEADPRNQLVSPTTNNTAIIEVPLSSGASYIQTNKIFEAFTARRYPEIMATGFCLLFERDLLDKIGLFDESYVSYGEDSDFWYRTIRYAEGSSYKRYRAVLADDTYVFHQRSGSFSQLGADAHTHLRKLASGRFNRIWPEWAEWRKSYDSNKALGNLREKIPPALLRAQEDNYRICWVVTSAEFCGGMSYITDIVNALIEKGINAKVAVIKHHPDAKENFMTELTTAPVFFKSYEDFIKDFRTKVFTNGFVVGATISLIPIINTLCELNPYLKPILHAQSYEIDMADYTVAPENLTIVKNQYINLYKTTKDIISSSSWITKRLETGLNVKTFGTIYPGVNIDLFYPRDRNIGDDRPTVLIPMVKGKNGFEKIKGYDRGLLLIHELERLADAKGLNLRILVYGADSLPSITSAICLGPIPQTQLAVKLGTEVDAFIDPSNLHSYGLPALEALASGVKVFSWDNKGIREYGENIVDIFPNDEHATFVASKIIDYFSDESKMSGYKEEVPTIRAHIEARHNRDSSVSTFINTLESYLNVNFIPRNISIIVPHLRKHGGPTTMLAIANELKRLGHNISISTVYPDINDEVVSMTDLPISLDPKNLGVTDLIITNSDNPLTSAISAAKNVKKIMLKLSHNPRFKKEEELGLNQKWDAIVTSSDWLKNVCENPTLGWSYPAAKATKIGWWHYTFEKFSCSPNERGFGSLDKIITIGTLIHAHPLKGTQDAISILGQLYLKYGSKIRFVGIGELPSFQCDLPNFQYVQSPTRDQMASILKQTDIWLGASHTEGLGRLGLEAMSASCAVVLSDTGAEYAKDKDNCLLYNVGDKDQALANIELIISDLDLATNLRESAFRTASNAADSSDCIKVLQRTIENVFK